MSRSALFLFGIAGVVAATGAACSANSTSASTSGGGNATTSANGGSTSTGKGGADASSSTGEDITIGVGTGGNIPGNCDSKADEDKDQDGWTKDDGDCNDCDVNANPGAIEVMITTPVGDGGIPTPADEDCDGMVDNVAPTCDDALALADVDPNNAAKAIDLCQTTTASPADKKDRKWGVLSSKYIGADGVSSRTPALQVGLLEKFGMSVKARLGKSMLGLSSGFMRAQGQAGTCANILSPRSCVNTTNGPPPAGFPQPVPGCPVDATIHDDIAFEVKLRSPTNATGYKFNFKFYTYEFPEFICSTFNDQFVALASPAPKGAINGNISFDSKNNPVSVNIAFFDVCDPSSISVFGKSSANKPPTPNPYCPSGKTDLIGTYMDGTANIYYAGATSWLQTSAPIQGGEDVTIRFAIWDTGDHNLDSTVLVDAFEWIANGGTVKVGTVKPPA